MSALTGIKKPVEVEMAEFELYFSRTMRSDIPLLNIILNYILRRKGKQMRPLLVFLTARLNGEIVESTYIAATCIELLHTASLVHDDVVDDANERSGFLSINALWNSKIAVLLGDYLLSTGMHICVEKSRYDMLEIISEAVKSMSEGELLQLQKARKLNIKEEDYYKIIISKKKTKAEISEVISFVMDYGGLEYAELKMNQYRDKALAILDSYTDSEVKESLREFVQYTTSRKK